MLLSKLWFQNYWSVVVASYRNGCLHFYYTAQKLIIVLFIQKKKKNHRLNATISTIIFPSKHSSNQISFLFSFVKFLENQATNFIYFLFFFGILCHFGSKIQEKAVNKRARLLTTKQVQKHFTACEKQKGSNTRLEVIWKLQPKNANKSIFRKDMNWVCSSPCINKRWLTLNAGSASSSPGLSEISITH